MTRDEARAAIELRILRGTQAHALAAEHNTTAEDMFNRLCEGDHALATGRPVQYAHGHTQAI
jgi:hypothetical protein